MEQYHHKVKDDHPAEQTNKMVWYKVELVKMRYLEEGEYFSRLVLKVQEDNLMMAPNKMYKAFLADNLHAQAALLHRQSVTSFLNLSHLCSWSAVTKLHMYPRYIPSILLATIAYCSLYLPPTSKVRFIFKCPDQGQPKKVPRIGMTLVTLLAVNTMINGIKAEMPRVKITQHHPRQSLILRSLTSRCPTPGSTPSPTTAASASSSSLLCRQETSSFQHNPCFCSIWWKWRRRMQPS